MGYPTQLGLWVGRSQALVAKKILFLSNWGSKRAGPQKLVAKEFLPLSNGSFKGAESCSQERKKPLVKFKVQKIEDIKTKGTWADPKYHRAWTSWCKARQRVRWSRSPVTTFTSPTGNKVAIS